MYFYDSDDVNLGNCIFEGSASNYALARKNTEVHPSPEKKKSFML